MKIVQSRDLVPPCYDSLVVSACFFIELDEHGAIAPDILEKIIRKLAIGMSRPYHSICLFHGFYWQTLQLCCYLLNPIRLVSSDFAIDDVLRHSYRTRTIEHLRSFKRLINRCSHAVFIDGLQGPTEDLGCPIEVDERVIPGDMEGQYRFQRRRAFAGRGSSVRTDTS